MVSIFRVMGMRMGYDAVLMQVLVNEVRGYE